MRYVRIFLQCVGALALLLLVAMATYILVYIYAPEQTRIKDKNQAVFILNWAGMNPSQNWNIIDSSISKRTFTGDHADYACIQLEDATVNLPTLNGWQSGPETNEFFAKALENAITWAKTENAECFPSFDLANSAEMKIMFWKVTAHDRSPTAAEVLLLHVPTKRLFYASFKT